MTINERIRHEQFERTAREYYEFRNGRNANGLIPKRICTQAIRDKRQELERLAATIPHSHAALFSPAIRATYEEARYRDWTLHCT